MHDIKPILVEPGTKMRLCNSNTDSIRKSLSEWASSDFNAISVVSLRMAGSQGVDLAEAFKVFNGELIAEEDEHDVLKGATVGMVSYARFIIMRKAYAWLFDEGTESDETNDEVSKKGTAFQIDERGVLGACGTGRVVTGDDSSQLNQGDILHPSPHDLELFSEIVHIHDPRISACSVSF